MGKKNKLPVHKNTRNISVIAVVYNEKDNIEMLINRIKDIMTSMPKCLYELIVVDDGSSDGTTKLLKKIAKQNKFIKPIFFARNYGQSTAIQAGFDHAKFDIVITMDGDLQNDPDDIPKMLKKLHSEKADMVSGWRKKRQDGKIRVLFSRIANMLISKITGVELHDYGCSLKVYKSSITKNIRLYGELHRFIPVLVSEIGGKIVEIDVEHHPRKAGKSKYNLTRTFRVLLDLLLMIFLRRFIQRPIHFFGGLGMTIGFFGFTICLYLAAQKIFFSQEIGDRPLLLLGITLIIGAIILISQGIVSEVVVRVMHEDKVRPQYRKNQ